MFSLPNSPVVADWFQRLEAAWRRMPIEERKIQREEVQQHLDGLVAAKVTQGQSVEEAWNDALNQFGDPTQIGRKVYQEWRQSITCFHADVTAILFGLGLWTLNYILIQLLFSSSLIIRYFTGSQYYSHWNRTITFDIVLQTLYFGGAFLIYGLIGRKHPFQAIKGALVTFVLSYLFSWVPITAYFLSSHVHMPLVMVTRTLLFLPLHLAGIIVLSYLASVTRRGWYRPSWTDFKITLPSRRRQVR